jgi:hypothetical protein
VEDWINCEILHNAASGTNSVGGGGIGATTATTTTTTTVIVNGALDKVRDGYYPSIFFPHWRQRLIDSIPPLKVSCTCDPYRIRDVMDGCIVSIQNHGKLSSKQQEHPRHNKEEEEEATNWWWKTLLCIHRKRDHPLVRHSK